VALETGQSGRPAGQTETPSALRLGLLEGFELTFRDHAVVLPLRAQRLLAFLAMHDRPLLRLHVAGVLWPDSSEQRASANLRSALWRLQRPRLPLVRATTLHLRLEDGIDVDLRSFTALANRVLGGSTEIGSTLSTDLCRAGELLPDWYDDWVLVERERFRQLRLHALEKLCARLTQAGRYSDAIQAGLAAVAGEPLRESAQRTLVRTYLAEGNDAEAVRQYFAYKQLLKSEMDLAPTAEMDRIVGHLLQ